MIEIEHLTTRYGEHTAVSDLNLRIESGQIYGFLGPNGAGKSTTLNIIAGCLSATEGCVRIEGCDIFEQPEKAKKHIGYLPEQPPLYMNETPSEYLRFVGEAKGLQGARLTEQIKAVLRQTKLEDVSHRRISALSKGYRQRVGIAQALLGDPEIIILDEPTVGLDPIQIIEIRDLIKELGQRHTVIFSSHILSEVQTLCDQIIMIAKGKLAAFDTPENLEKSLLASNTVSLLTEADAPQVEALLGGVPHITSCAVTRRDNGLTAADIQTDLPNGYELSRAVFTAFARGGKSLLELRVKKAGLEDIFLELAEDGAPAEAETPKEEESAPNEADAPKESEVAADGGSIEA